MPATGADLIESMDRLARAVQALTAKQTPPTNPQSGQPGQPAPGTPGGPPAGTPTSHLQSPKHPLHKLRSAWGRFGEAHRLMGQGRLIAGTRKAQRAGKSIGSMIGRLFGKKAGKVGGKAGGPAGVAIAMTVAAAEAIYKFKKAVESVTDRLVESHRRLAEVSPSMAAGLARRDVQELMRNRQQGEQLSESAQRLFEAEQRRKDRLLVTETAFENIKNEVLAVGNDILAGVVTGNGYLSRILIWLGLWKDEQESNQSLSVLGESAEAFRQLEKDRIERQRKRLDRHQQIITNWPGMDGRG